MDTVRPLVPEYELADPAQTDFVRSCHRDNGHVCRYHDGVELRRYPDGLPLSAWTYRPTIHVNGAGRASLSTGTGHT